jgi:hypothetical protein
MFDWLWKRLGGVGGSSGTSGDGSEEVAPGAAVDSTMGSTTSAAAADNDTAISVIADNDNASDDVKMGDATMALAGGSATKEEGVATAAIKKNKKEVTATKAKPTVAKNKSVAAGSTLTAVRTGNTRPVVPKKKLGKKTGATTTTTTTISTGKNAPPRDGCDSFPDMLERLANYKAKHGNCRVPLKYAADPALAAFVKKMRRQYKAVIKVSLSGGAAETDPVSDESSTTTPVSSSLTIDQIRQLDQLDFVWEGKRGRPSHPK